MKSLYESLVDNMDPRDEIMLFLKTNYINTMSKFIISKEPNEKGLYEVKCNDATIMLKKPLTHITNGMFEFVNRQKKKIKLYCGWGENLESLEGLPTEIEYIQILANKKMRSLKDIKGWPEIIDEFCLFNCPNLISLEGGPKYVKTCVKIEDCGKLFTKDEVKKYIKTNDDTEYVLKKIKGT